ncbi:thiopeptide-type bacteriocin biosynthesis protein [Streptomyces sp. NPDC005407]|uniref:thiopeptide-type bacteriocin biosynthesis protein n=1 Tax=Streptomyces sp. NPDC005407 TaxID=3155340 RepID=UPI0033A19BAB
MSAHQLTPAAHPSCKEVSRAVRAVLAGELVDNAARRIGMHPIALMDAVHVFTEAGTYALTRQDLRTQWSQFYVEFTDWTAAEQIAGTYLVPMLNSLEDSETTPLWWFIRKHPCWRLRIYGGPEALIHAELDKLVQAGHLRRWWPGTYEPETAAFGGASGMLAAHVLFSADSHHILNHADVPLGCREMSVVLCTIMMRAAGLEWYEQGDVWGRVINEEHRSDTSKVLAGRLEGLTRQIRQLLVSDTAPQGQLLCIGAPLQPITEWAEAFRRTGNALREGVQAGTLERGLRRVLAYHVIFHWNRLGLSLGAQSALALAARTAILDPPPNAAETA